VKGSDIGTPTDPKFALRTLWEEIILPAYDALTAVGGPAEGAVIVHQEDNAPPHQEGDFHAWLVEEFQKRGWRLELQAPQGSYTNVLDLQVKIIMPLHLRLPVTCILSIRQCQTTVAGYDRIWQVAQNVWKGITSAMVCRAFILAYRIMNKIIEEDGNNAWLCHGTPHCYVRRDFVDTFDGILPYFGVERNY
jgi:hypothetical protein